MSIKSLATGALLLLTLPSMADEPKSRPYNAPDIATFVQLENAFLSALTQYQLEPLKQYYSAPSSEAKWPLWESKKDLGWGRLMFNDQATQAIFLQVPHRYHDKYTWDIAKHWLATGRIKLAMINNVHRYAGRDATPKVNSDFSNAPNSPMIAATRAFIHAYPQPMVIQLHGFSQQKHRDDKAAKAEIILSHGAKLSIAELNRLQQSAACLNQTLKLNALVYPSQIDQLGGTLNLVGQAIRDKGLSTGFVHVEMSHTVRQKLKNDASAAIQLLNCLIGVAP